MKKMIAALLSVFFLQFALAQVPNKLTLEGAWLQADVKWINAPSDINPHLQSAQAAVLYFGEDHKFALIYCTVGRAAKQSMTISNGDPRGVYQGEWSIRDDTISVKYQLVEATILPQGQKLPGPIQSGALKASKDSILVFDGKSFRRASALDKSAAEAMHGVRQSSRNSVDRKHSALRESKAVAPTNSPTTVTTH